MSKRVEPSNDRKLQLLEKMVKSIFGINATIDYSHWEVESDKIVIKDINYSEDLLEVLQNLRREYYVTIEPDIRSEVIELEKTKVKTNYPILNLVLYLK